MRILFLNPIGSLGGAEMSLLDILAVLRDAESDWQLGLILGESGPLLTRAQALGVSAKVVPLLGKISKLGDSSGPASRTLWSRASYLLTCLRAGVDLIPYIFRLRNAVQEFNPDIIHTNGFKMHVLGPWSRRNRTPVVWHIRDYASTRPVMSRLLMLHQRWCSAAITNSQSVCRDLQRICGSKLITRCIYNRIDLANYSPEGKIADLDALSAMAPAPLGTVRIGLIATMAHWKGHTVFLRALARLSPDLPYRAYVIGDSIYNTAGSQLTIHDLRALTAELKISDKVGFTGFMDDPASAIRALDIVVHASTQPEPFGRVVAESMACGRPVISSAIGGASEIINAGYDSMAHPPGDEARLAQRIEELAQDPELRSRIGKAARSTAERRFDRRQLAMELIPVYQGILTKQLQSA